MDFEWIDWRTDRVVSPTDIDWNEDEWRANGGDRFDELPTLPKAPAAVEIPPMALAVSREQAAALLSISLDTFERRVVPEIKVAQIGARQLIPVRELEDYLNRKTARALKG